MKKADADRIIQDARSYHRMYVIARRVEEGDKVEYFCRHLPRTRDDTGISYIKGVSSVFNYFTPNKDLATVQSRKSEIKRQWEMVFQGTNTSTAWKLAIAKLVASSGALPVKVSNYADGSTRLVYNLAELMPEKTYMLELVNGTYADVRLMYKDETVTYDYTKKEQTPFELIV